MYYRKFYNVAQSSDKY